MTDGTQMGLLQNLPDYATLKKFAAALWQENPSFQGAAIMVGAGFSRSAAETAVPSKKLPLWYDFIKVLQSELGAYDTTDPLRIAEEYKAFFGNHALSQLIRKEVDDLVWQPGELYTSLLELPWKEVLTTNWDTLLERKAAEITGIDYSIVNRGNDLARTASPRITKLHGTIGVTDELIFTQEEYRQYPVNHAAFVNFARQVFIENELCLLGFSGDDPNFLQWAGWVRDNLQDSARRIYLVGSLNLSPTKRKYLESINISPIDLYSLVSKFDDPDLQHFEATKIFLNALSELKPKDIWEWRPTSLEGSKLAHEEQLKILQQDRLSYPDWIICPSVLKDDIRRRVGYELTNSKFLDSVAGDFKAKILFEQMWSFKVTNTIAPLSLLESYLDVAEDISIRSISLEEKVEFALFVLVCSRWFEGDEKVALESRASKLIKSNSIVHKAAVEVSKLHNAYSAMLDLDYNNLEKILSDIKPCSPDLKLKKANLLSMLGHFEEGRLLLEEARDNLITSFKKDSNSIYLLSRLNLVETVLEITDWNYEKNNKVHELSAKKRCSYWREKESFDRYVQTKLDKQIEKAMIRPLFEAGKYKDNSKQQTLSNEQHPLIALDMLTRIIGIPVKWNGTNHLTNSTNKLIQFEDIDLDTKLNLIILSCNQQKDQEVALDKILSRVAVANLTSDKCGQLITRFQNAVDFWINHFDKLKANREGMLFSYGRLSLFLEILARISIRAQAEKAIELFEYSTGLIKNKVIQHYLLFDSLSNLINYSLKSTPISYRKNAFEACLYFPLAAELNIDSSHKNWPNPSINCDFNRSEFERLGQRIEDILKYIRRDKNLALPALNKLLPLIDKGFLTEKELNILRHNLWAEEVDKFPDKGLLKWVYLNFVTENNSELLAHFKKEVFDVTNSDFLSYDNLLEISNSVYTEVSITSKEAEECFNSLISWRPKKDVDRFDLFFRGDTCEEIGRQISAVLNCVVVKALKGDILNQSNFDKIIQFCEFPSCYMAMESLVYFAKHNAEFDGKLGDLIGTKLHSSNHQSIIAAAYTLVKWRELSENQKNKELVTSLILMVSANKEASGLHVVKCLTRLLKNNHLSDTQKMMLSNIIPAVFGSTNYQQASFRNEELVNIPLMRVELSKLAQLLLLEAEPYSQGLKIILEEIKEDPLPEVRYSL